MPFIQKLEKWDARVIVVLNPRFSLVYKYAFSIFFAQYITNAFKKKKKNHEFFIGVIFIISTKWTYDVFVSFKGKDTSNTFTRHLR